MRKLILILVIAVVAIAARGQTATFHISPKNSYKIVNTNYTLTNATAVWFQWEAERNCLATQDYQVNLDSLSGNHTNIAIKLYGRKFDSDSWTQIGTTVNSTDSTATETISNTAPNRYRQYKAEFSPTGTGVTTIDFQILKIWNE
jgi:hypothetical protein